jgi:hypothetical protein
VDPVEREFRLTRAKAPSRIPCPLKAAAPLDLTGNCFGNPIAPFYRVAVLLKPIKHPHGEHWHRQPSPLTSKPVGRLCGAQHTPEKEPPVSVTHQF